MAIRSVCLAAFAALGLGGLPARAQTPAAVPPVAPAQRGQAAATVNAPIELFSVPVRVTAPNPVAYTGSAYRNDVSGQSESNSDAAIAEDTRQSGPRQPDAW